MNIKDFIIDKIKNITFYSTDRIDKEEMSKDIHLLIGNWFCALEDEGCEPWKCDDCIRMANKYGYTKKDYKDFLSTIY